MEQFGVTRSSMHSQGWQRCRVRRGSGRWAGPCFSCLHRVPDDAGKPLSNSDCTFTAILTACGKLGWEIDRAWDYVRSKVAAGGRQHLPRELQHMLQVRQKNPATPQHTSTDQRAPSLLRNRTATCLSHRFECLRGHLHPRADPPRIGRLVRSDELAYHAAVPPAADQGGPLRLSGRQRRCRVGGRLGAGCCDRGGGSRVWHRDG